MKLKPSHTAKRKGSNARHKARAFPDQRPVGAQYKVVELSTVDESALEDVLNEYSRQGWTLDGLQFAMRESSRRPAMAFVLFTRPGNPLEALPQRLVQTPSRAHARLRELAGLDDGEP